MTKMIGILAVLLSLQTWALVPVEGILLGEASNEIQVDPLLEIFNTAVDKSDVAENGKLQNYKATTNMGQYLNENCSTFGTPRYATPWQEKQVRRTIAATLQYIGLDTTIKAIGAYAKKLEIPQDQYSQLTKNIVSNYCSKNVTVFSLKTIERSLKHYYDNPSDSIIPSISSSPYVSQSLKVMSETAAARSNEFDLVVKNFRAFCSWGGEVEDYRLLSSYLKNPIIMNFVINNLSGIKFAPKINGALIFNASPNNLQVSCVDFICRKQDLKTFRSTFPLSVGSTGIRSDLIKNYCHHFRYQDLPQNTIPQVKAWIKKMEIEEPILETSHFISLMTGVPDFLNSVDSYQEIPAIAKSSIDERWTKWASSALSSFSTDLFYEESFKVRVEPRRDLSQLATQGFMIDFSVTLGEMDRLMKNNDKLSVSFDLKLTKNYLRELQSKWAVLERDVDTEGKKEFKANIARYLNIQLKEKEKLFTQKLWNDDFPRLIGEELLEQVLTYRGSFFDSYKEEVIRVPVKFSYGLFAIGYLRYRSDVAAGRSKLNL